jgi:ferric-dicitrate binding protein FerR (iron transport regulator)
MNKIPDNMINDDLLAKYLSGENIGLSEKNDIEIWISENSDYYQEFEKLWTLSRKTSAYDQFDEKKALTLVKNRLYSERKVNHIKFYRAVAAIALIIIITAALFLFLNSPEEKMLTAEAINSQLKIDLSDGTTVELNKGSILNYPELFSGDFRNVTLAGEAFFKVATDTGHPFVITSGNTVITVLGTSFCVSGNKNKTEIVVETGKVKACAVNNPDDMVIINPGEKAINNGNQIIKSKNSDPNYLAWKTKILIFDRTDISNVFQCIEKTYACSVEINDQSILNLQLTATFENQSIETVFEIIEQTLDIEITGDNGSYFARRK